jgi:hypothetical protein
MSKVVVGHVAAIAVALCLLLSFGCLSQTPGSKVNRAGAVTTPKASATTPTSFVAEPIAFSTLAYRVTIAYDADVGSDGPLPFEAVTIQALASASIPVLNNPSTADAVLVVTGRVDSLSGLYGSPYYTGLGPRPQMKYITGSRVQGVISLVRQDRTLRSTTFAAEKSPPASIQISGSVIGTVPWGPSYMSTFAKAFPPAISNFVQMIQKEQSKDGRAP